MRISILLYFVFICLFGNFSCFNDLDEFSFSEVITNGDYKLGPELGEVTLKGSIYDTSTNEVVRVGFLLSTDLNQLDTFDFNQLDSFNGKVIEAFFSEENTFVANVKNLDLDQQYYFRAIGEFRNNEIDSLRKVYGNIKELSFEIIITIPDTISTFNDTAMLIASISGLRDGIIAMDHGYVYSSIHELPVYIVDTTISLGELNDNTSYNQHILSGLSFNTTYYVRAWAMTKDTIYYSDSVGLAVIRDGWRAIDTLNFTLQDASAIVAENKVYIIGGCDHFSDCSSGSNFKKTWIYDPFYKSVVDFAYPSPQDRHNAVGFALGDSIYYGLGENRDANISPDNYFNDFSKVNIHTGNWVVAKGINNKMSGRAGAVAFVINGYAYLGTGHGGNNKFHDDFYQYHPVYGIRSLNKLPVRLWPEDKFDTLGRSDAVVFVIGEFAYLMGGYVESGKDLKDVWKFIPPMSNDTSDKGEWQSLGFFPGTPRSDAVAFSISNLGYICSGNSETIGRLNDLWEYHPEEDEFIRVTSFPIAGREEGISFFIGNGKGYFGMGESEDLKPHGDIWEYTPLKR